MKFEHRPVLDSIRGIASILVLMFHSGALANGYAGVDVFFVLSGFLINSLIIREIKNEGQLNFPKFYSRRFRRLQPMAVLVLILTAIVYIYFQKSFYGGLHKSSFISSSLYYENLNAIITESDYFQEDEPKSPVIMN